MAFDDGVKTVSGSIAHTDDAATKVPFVSVKCGIEPTLSGVSEVTETQTGRNLVALNVSPQQAKRDYGVTVNTQTADTLNITSTGVAYACERLFYSFKKGTYAVKFLATSSDSFTPVISIYRTNGTGVKFNIQSNTVTTFTLAEDADLDIRFFASGSGDTTIRTVEFSYLQIEVGSTVSTYSQYNSTTYTASLGRTIYGGQADIVNGTGTENCTNRNLVGEGFTWVLNTTDASFPFFTIGANAPNKASNKNFVCEGYVNRGNYRSVLQDGEIGVFNNTSGINRFCVRDDSCTTLEQFLEKNANTKITYEVTTPTDFTFTPITPTPETVGKVNNVYCNTGNTEVTYYDNAHGFSEVTVNMCGKNVLPNIKTRGSDTRVNLGQSDDGFSLFLKKGTYTLSATASINCRGYYRGENDGSNTLLWSTYTTDGHGTFTLSEDTNVRIWLYNGDGLAVTDVLTFMLEVGSTAHAYEPYEAVSKTAYLHKVIYGGTADVVKGTCEPKNLLDDNKRVFTSHNIIFGRDSGGRDDFCLKLKAGTYTFSVTTADGTYTNLYLKNSDTKESISGFPAYATSSKSFTLAEDTNCAVFVYKSDYTSVSDITSAQIEKGSTASEYVPHFDPFTFPPISISTDEGENTLFANEGDSAITYRKAVE